MTWLTVVRKAFRDVRGTAVGAAITVFVIVLIHAALYPSYYGKEGIQYPEALKGIFGEAGSITSPEGYNGAYLSNVTTFLAVVAVIVGTGATAGEEGAGTLDLLLSQPVPRRRLLSGKTVGLAAGLSLATLAGIPGFWLAGFAGDQHMSVWRFAQAALSELSPVLFFLSLGLLAGARLSSRAVAGTFAAAVVVAGYFLNAIGGAVDFLATPRKLSPFYWTDNSHVLLHGFDWLRAGGFFAGSMVLLGLAARSFQRRELSTGAPEGGLRLPWRTRRTAEEVTGAPAIAPLGGVFAGRFGFILKTLRDARGATVAAGIAAIVYVFLVVLIYPAYHDMLKDLELPAGMQGMLGEAGSIASPEGFMTVEFFNQTILIFVAVAIIFGTGATAGEEGAGTIDLLLSQPIGRRRLLASKFAGMSIALVIATLVALPGFIIARRLAGMDIATGRFFGGEINVLSLEFVFLGFATFAGAVLPSRSAAVMLSVGTMVALYLLPTLADVSDFFATARKVSPFYWADVSRVLIHGFDWFRAGSLFGVGVLFFALALWCFERRDLASGRREWSLRAALHPGRRRPPTVEPSAASGGR